MSEYTSRLLRLLKSEANQERTVQGSRSDYATKLGVDVLDIRNGLMDLYRQGAFTIEPYVDRKDGFSVTLAMPD